MKKMKKLMALLLAFVLVAGAVNLPQKADTAKAAATKKGTLTKGKNGYNCQTGSNRWLLYFDIGKDSDGNDLTLGGDIYWNNNTVYIDGVAHSGTGVNYTRDLTNNDLMFCLTFDHAPMGTTHTLLIPKGTVIGDIEVQNDLTLVLGKNNGVYEATPVQLTYTGGGPQDDSLGSRYALHFKVPQIEVMGDNYWTGCTNTGYATFDNTVYVGDSKVSGDGVNYVGSKTDNTLSLYLQYGKIKDGVTKNADLDPFALNIPMGTLLGNTPAKYLVTTKSITLDINKGTISQVVEPNKTVTLSNDVGRNQGGNCKNGFYFYTSEDDGLTADSSWNTRYSMTTGGIYVNDSVVSGAKLVKILSNLYYVAFDGCGITFKAGDTVKIDGMVNKDGYVVKYEAQTFEYDGSGNWDIYVPKTEVTLALGTGSAAQDGDKRFLIYLTGADLEQMTDMDGKVATLTIDGVEKTGASSYVKLNDTTFVLLLKYADLEADKTLASTMSPHTIQIKAGTVIGGWEVADDVIFHTIGTTVESGEYVPNGVTLAFGAGSGAQDNQKRFLVYLTGANADQMTAMDGKAATLTIDGVEKTGASSYVKLDDTTFVLLLMYSDLESGVEEASKLGPHTVEISAGTMIADYTVSDTVSISIDSDTIVDTASLTKVNLSLAAEPESGAQDNNKRYCLYLDGFTKDQITALNGKRVPIYVDDVKVASHTDMYFFQMANYDTTVLYLLPYELLESDITEAAKLSPHVVEFKEGTIFNGSYVLGEDLVLKTNKTDVAEYVKPNLVNPEVVDAVTTSVDGTVLTVNGTGTIKASDLASVTAANITEIKIEGPCNIASQAFVGYTALTKVWFSNTVLTAADDAFSGCASGVKAIYVKGRTLTGGLADVDAHEYYSFKILTLGSSYGEDTNNYIYTLAKNYYSNLPGRTAEDIAYDDIVVAELFTGGGTLAQRVNGILGNPVITCYYEKWDEKGTVIPTTPTGQLTGENMKMALQDEYWDTVILMQSAEDSKKASSFLVSTAGNEVADIDTVINYVKANNKNHSGSKYMWLQTWSYNYKLSASGEYEKAIGWEEEMRVGIAKSMQTVVQERVDLGGLDGIVPVGASIEYLKKSYLNAEDSNYTSASTSGTYNEGAYSNYFAIQRDAAHASIGLGRFTLGLTAFGYLADLENTELQTLANMCYPQNYEECEVSVKLEGEQSATKAYLKYDMNTKDCAPQAYSAAIKALADPYMEGTVTKICKTGDVNGDDVINALDLIRYKKNQEGTGTIVDEATADINMDGVVDAKDLAALRAIFVDVTTIKVAEQGSEAVSLLNGGVRTFAENYSLEAKGSSVLYATKSDCYAPQPVTLSWEKVEGATSYTVKVGQSADLSDAKSYDTATNTWKLTNLLSDAHYYYQVIANLAEGTVDSQIYDFATEALPRTVSISGVSNSRDIGGYYTEDGKYRIKQNIVWRSGWLNDITAAGRTTILEDFGVKTVLALNGEKNDNTYLGTDALNYISVSAPWYAYEVSGVVATEYRAALLTELRVFADADNYPILFHCSAGKDRTGTLATLLNALCGVSEKDLYLDYELSAFSYWLWKDTSYTDPVGSHMSWITDFMTYLKGFEGETLADKTENFMLSIGMTAEEIQNIRTNLREEI